MRYDNLILNPNIPQWLLRLGVRAALELSTQRSRQGAGALQNEHTDKIARFKRGPIATYTQQANLQHYDVPVEFFKLVLGPRLKYSCCYWPAGVEDLAGAEQAMLELSCQRAALEDGMRVLDLGCGWGSLTMWIAERYPRCEIVAVSNSRIQIDHIAAECARQGLRNVLAVHGDVTALRLGTLFDRVLSIEMFEHMKNYEQLLAKIASWLYPGGSLFVHHFSHRERIYEFKMDDPHDFMARTYFAGGTMPSDDMLLHFQRHLRVRDRWRISGLEYARTLRAWLDHLNQQRREVIALFSGTYGETGGHAQFARWRLFFLICEETFKLRNGNEYLVSHYRMDKP
jgi:cyclopropane-fatty-acyl-phospholipid synthase